MEQVSKANQMKKLIRRSFVYLDTENFTRLYKAIVRPDLEYANSVWITKAGNQVGSRSTRSKLDRPIGCKNEI